MGRQRDMVDRVREQWAAERPELDTSAFEVIGRVSRLARITERRLIENFEAHGLDGDWMFDVMMTLRRAGEPYELTAGELVRQTMVTTGAMTNRIDRLEARGYVKRIASSTDRRVVLVRLLPEGRRIVDETAETHYELERELLRVLSPGQQAKLSASLRTLLVDLGDVPADRE
jgi:DNA-binding MarR family transcriptional regulator